MSMYSGSFVYCCLRPTCFHTINPHYSELKNARIFSLFFSVSLTQSGEKAHDAGTPLSPVCFPSLSLIVSPGEEVGGGGASFLKGVTR